MSEKGKSINNGSPTKHGAHAPDSMNYYESYFEDSFVGELSAEADSQEKLSSENINEITWQDEEKINNALEFGFDSFGPESILFQGVGHSGDSGGISSPKKVVEDHPQEEEQRSTQSRPPIKERQSVIRRKEQQQAQAKQEEEEERQKEEKSDKKNEIQPANLNSLSDFEFVSLSISEPQLKQKLDDCFDEDKIKNSYEISDSNQIPPPSIVFIEKTNEIHSKTIETIDRSLDVEDVEENSNSFKRNGTLTQSQRRKISPKFKFEEILNTSDDVNLQVTPEPVSMMAKDETEQQLTNISTINYLDSMPTNNAEGLSICYATL